MKERLVFFDVLRILAIALIVVCHLFGWFHISSPGNIFTISEMKFNLFYWGVGAMMVSLLVLISGAMIEYSYGLKEKLNPIRFLIKRAIRLYPAYWMSIILTLLFIPALLSKIGTADFLYQWFGIKSFTLTGNGSINAMGFFIGLIMVLYAFYPLISHHMKKNPFYTISVLAIVTFGLRYLIGIYDLNKYQLSTINTMLIERWNPLCNLFMFGLGILIIQQKWYPKILHSNKYLTLAAELTFYVFLIHTLTWNYVIAMKNIYIYIIFVLFSAYAMMIIDGEIQKRLKNYFGL